MRRQLIIQEEDITLPGLRVGLEYQSKTRYCNFDGDEVVYYVNTTPNRETNTKDLIIAGIKVSKPYSVRENSDAKAINVETIDDSRLSDKVNQVGKVLMDMHFCRIGHYWTGNDGIAEISK